MDLQLFLEKFLPEYEQKITSYRLEYFSNSPIKWDISGKEAFNKLNFPEALQNFADKICEKQKDNCLEAVEYAYDHLTYMNGINNSGYPKIEEL